MSKFWVGTSVLIAIAVSGCDAAGEVQGDMVDAEMNSLAKQQIEVYDIAKKNDDKMEACTQGMAIAQIFLQSKDEQNWKSWKEKSEADCKDAGIPVS